MVDSFDESLEQIMERGFRGGLNALAPWEHPIFVISNADFEVNLGGVSGYLYNSAGDQIELLATSFERIGCSRLALRATEVLDALRVLKCTASDRQSRCAVLASRDQHLLLMMDNLETAIQDRVEDYGQMLVAYYESVRNSQRQSSHN